MEKQSEIYLRPMTVDDTDDIVKWRNSESVKQFFIYQGEFTRESHLNWIETRVNTGEVIQFMIVLKKNDKAIGSVFLRDVDMQNKKAEYGIFIGDESVRGKGYGSVAARLILKHAFYEAGLHRVYLRVLADNERAIKSYEKVGFKKEGYLTDDVFVRGSYRDVVWMAIVNPEGKAE